MNKYIDELSDVLSRLDDLERKIVLAYIQGLIFSKKVC